MSTDKPQNSFITMFDRLRSSHLFLLLAGLFLLDLVIPDPFPFVDEAILGLLTLLVARWRLREPPAPAASRPPPKNVTPPAP